MSPMPVRLLSTIPRAPALASNHVSPTPSLHSIHTTASSLAASTKEQLSSTSRSPSSGNLRSSQTDPEPSRQDAASRAAQLEVVRARKEKEGGLMSELSAAVLFSGIQATTEPHPGKILREFSGVHLNSILQPVQHPSGFIPQPPACGANFTPHPKTLPTPLTVSPLPFLSRKPAQSPPRTNASPVPASLFPLTYIIARPWQSLSCATLNLPMICW